MDHVPSPSADRRSRDRRSTAIPIRIDTDTRPDRMGIIWNLSQNGALVATPSRFQIADHAVLRMHSEGREARDVDARIIRIEVNDPKSAGLFRYKVALRFFDPLPPELLEESER